MPSAPDRKPVPSRNGSAARSGRPLRKIKVRFSVLSSLAREIYVAGDFNNWNRRGTRLRREHGNVWSAEVMLRPGVYEYLFLVDGHWETDPGARTVRKAFGTRNSVLHVAPRPKRRDVQDDARDMKFPTRSVAAVGARRTRSASAVNKTLQK